MPILCLGLSHHTAPVDVRERHAFPAERMGEALTVLRTYDAVREAAMLATCGRLEIYAELDDYELGVEQIKAFLTQFRHGSVGYDLESYLYTLLGREAIEHLFRVTTGLDSMLIGEAEILGQVKDAYVQAHQVGALGASLHRLFGDAINAGKTARSKTCIGQESASVATAAIDLARARLGSLVGRKVLVVGAGKMGRTAGKRLYHEGVAELVIMNRTFERAQALVDEIGFGKALSLEHVSVSLVHADIVVTSTGASSFMVSAPMVAAAMAQRPQRPLFIIDIAVPRDVDPAVAQISDVSLVDIDGLRDVVDGRLEVRREAIPHVEAIVAEYVARFSEWYRSRLAVPVIASLTQKADAIRMSEIERLFARCPDLSERERTLIAGASMTIVSRLLHSAVVKIRDKAVVDREGALESTRLLEELFELRSQADART
ncbi:MAG: glutamyl-tRNA reductase [Vulcanimicrobiaceae bacterium]